MTNFAEDENIIDNDDIDFDEEFSDDLLLDEFMVDEEGSGIENDLIEISENEELNEIDKEEEEMSYENFNDVCNY